MALIRSERSGEVEVLFLARGKANALNAELVDELAAAVERVATDATVRALVLGSDAPGLFCAGFDVREVFAYDRAQMIAFFGSFVRCFERLRTLPKPVVGSLSGHAFAGGAILALAADFRVLAQQAVISVNEVDLAVSLPAPMIRALAATTGPELARSMLLGAEEIGAPRALAAGLVSEVLPAADVLIAAVRRARVLGSKPPTAFAVHKQALDSVGSSWLNDAALQQTIDAWFAPEASARRRALQQKLDEKLSKKS
jgi:enoyl-CoA hydratase/carnithine racemase